MRGLDQLRKILARYGIMIGETAYTARNKATSDAVRSNARFVLQRCPRGRLDGDLNPRANFDDERASHPEIL